MDLILQSETGAEKHRVSDMPAGSTPEVIFMERAEPPEIYVFHMVGPEGAIYRLCTVTARLNVLEVEAPQGIQ